MFFLYFTSMVGSVRKETPGMKYLSSCFLSTNNTMFLGVHNRSECSTLEASENEEDFVLKGLSYCLQSCLHLFIIVVCNITWTFFSDTRVPSSFLSFDDSDEPS